MTKELNKKQEEAVRYSGGPLLIVAGAGTGKTTVITEKIARLIENGAARPEQILALTFTDKTAQEMQDRVDARISTGYVDLQISTFHSLGERLLREYGIDIGLPNEFRVLSQADAWMLMRKNIYEFNLDYYRPLGNPARHIKEFADHFSKCKDELISPQEYLDYAEHVRLALDDDKELERGRLVEIARAYHTYNQLMLDSACMDFGDLIYHSVRLLRERPRILERLRARFTHILVDEFQDVNYGQYELVKLLAGDRPLTVVGDDDQSIYAFRGASVSNILRFKEDYPNAKEVVLTDNYRSGQEILDAAGRLIAHNNPDRLEVKLGIDKHLKSAGAISGGTVAYIHETTLDGEARAVAEKIKELKTDDISYDDFGILVRANSHTAPFLSALECAGIPYEYIAAAGLFRQPIVLDAVNFFRLLDNYKESDAVYRLLKMPFLQMSVGDIHTFTGMAKKKSAGYFEALKRATEFGLSPGGIIVCNTLRTFIDEGMKRAQFERPTAVLYRFMEDSGYFAYLTAQEEAGDRSLIRQMYHLTQFFDYIGAYEKAHAGADVRSFMEHFSMVLESGDSGTIREPEGTPDSVNIMTVHRAKGLEFRFVFVVNMVHERFPSRRQSEGIEIPDDLIKERAPEGDAHIQEERRLAYVAMTRAKEKLFLSSADNYGGVKRKKPSQFLVEAGVLSASSAAITERRPRGEIVLPRAMAQTEGKGEFVYALPKKFSISQIQDFLKCPYLYKLKYLLKVPEKGSPYFSFGTAMHLTLQRFYERVRERSSVRQDSLFGLPCDTHAVSNIKVPPLDELLALYEQSWIDDWFESARQRADYEKKGRESLRAFYARNDGHWTVPAALEKYFQIRMGQYRINGKIDRVDAVEDGGLEIVDYKTGASKEKVIGADKDQLLLYQIAASTLPEYTAIGKVKKLTYYYLNDDLQTSFLGTDKDVAKLEEKIVKTLDTMHETDWHALTRESHSCRECERGLV